MFFKNLLVYHVNAPSMTAESLEAALDSHRAAPCSKHDTEVSGFVSPFGGAADGLLVHAAAGHLMVCLQTESKVLPSSVVRDAVQEKIEEIELRDDRKVYRKEKQQIKDEIMLDLLPRAFVKRSHLFAFFTSDKKYLVIDTASRPKAEELISMIRNALTTLPCIPLKVNAIPGNSMTTWIKNDRKPPEGISIGRSCELYNPLELSSVIRCKDVDLDSEEVQQCLEVGMQCSKLSIHWNDSLSALMTDDLAFRGVRFGDVVSESLASVDYEDRAAYQDAEFALMAGTIHSFIGDIRKALGTKEGPAQLDMVGEAA